MSFIHRLSVENLAWQRGKVWIGRIFNSLERYIRAERRLGEIMADQHDAGMMAVGAMGNGSNQYQQVRVADEPAPITLSEVGIDKNLADRARNKKAGRYPDLPSSLAVAYVDPTLKWPSATSCVTFRRHP